ncbi:hypothetical protein AAC387_Pa07g3748 [Persea americana]
MYLEFDNITFQVMSNPETFVLEEVANSLEFKRHLRPKSEFAIGCQVSASEEFKPVREETNQVENCLLVASEELQIKAKTTEDDAVAAATAAAVEVEDGYQTPTSPEHKIPTPRQCPPAPKKPRSTLLMKRKVPSDSHSFLISLSNEELELLFRPILTDSGCKNKKGRTGD